MMEEIGDRGVVILDARNSIDTSIRDAKEFNGNRRPIYNGFKIFQGESFLNANPITELIEIHH